MFLQYSKLIHGRYTTCLVGMILPKGPKMIWMINIPTYYGYSKPTITKLAVICNCEIISVINICIHNLCLKADSHIACRAHAVPLPCRAAKVLECVFPFDLHTTAVSDSPMPCPCHCSDRAVLLKAMAQHSCCETACGLPP